MLNSFDSTRRDGRWRWLWRLVGLGKVGTRRGRKACFFCEMTQCSIQIAGAAVHWPTSDVRDRLNQESKTCAASTRQLDLRSRARLLLGRGRHSQANQQNLRASHPETSTDSSHRPGLVSFRPTSKMSHGLRWRAACRLTIRNLALHFGIT